MLARHSRSPLAGPLATLPALGRLRRRSATSVATPPHPTPSTSRDLYREPRRDNHAVAGARLSAPTSSEKSVYKTVWRFRKRAFLLTFVSFGTAQTLVGS